jgi:hypothetical protein
VFALLVLASCGEEEPAGRRETVAGYTVVHLHGTPHQMGRQHAALLREELREGLKEIEENLLLKGMFALAKSWKLDELAAQRSLPEIVEECEGMAAEMGSEGWTLDKCLVLNFGDAVAEFVKTGVPPAEDLQPGCAQVLATGAATGDGRLYHARILDWSRIEYIIKHPVILVRHPRDGIAHVVIGFPGNLSPYQGMNAEGIAIASNEVHPKDSTVNDRTGESHVQLLGRILARARGLDEVRSMIQATNHMTLETIVASDGKSGKAAVFEMAPSATAIREPNADGVTYATNHFLEAATTPLDAEPAPEHSLIRLERLAQLLAKGGAESLHGKLGPGALVQLMRDRKNPRTGEQSAASEFDDGESLATNGALYQLVFDPGQRRFWLAAGKLPVPAQPFTGFSLDRLLEGKGSAPNPIP